MDSVQDPAEILDRIARTPDGLAFYRYLQNQLCGICLDPNDGALRSFEGRRIFVRELMAFMSEGIEASDTRNNIIIGKRDAGGGDRKRRKSIREYLAGEPSWTAEQRPTDDIDKPA